jgi:hypothetical protein
MAKKMSRAVRVDDLIDAVVRGNVGDVQQVLAAGIHPDARDDEQEPTPLMVAAAQGRLEIVTLLLRAGANVNALCEDLSGELDQFAFLDGLYRHGRLTALTALTYAALYRHQEVLDCLAPLVEPGLRREADEVRRAIAETGASPPRPYFETRETAPTSGTSRDAFLAAHPKLRRSIKTCPLCGGDGYDPELVRKSDPGVDVKELKRLFRPLPMTKDGYCEKCKRKIEEATRKRDARRRK